MQKVSTRKQTGKFVQERKEKLCAAGNILRKKSPGTEKQEDGFSPNLSGNKVQPYSLGCIFSL